MQLSFDAADRLVELVEARRGPVSADEAARILFALSSAPAALARSLLDDVVTGDARLAWRGRRSAWLRRPGRMSSSSTRTSSSSTSRRPGSRRGTSRICEIGAQRVRRLELEDAYETLVDPRAPLPPAVTSLTGIHQETLRGAPSADLAVRRLLAFTGDAAVVAHNARFDLALPRPRGRAAHGEAHRLAGGRHGLARAPPARRAHAPGRTRLAGALLRRPHGAVPPCAARRASDRGDPAGADRPRSGARRPDARRHRRARGAEGAASADEAVARRGRAVAAGGLRLPRTRRAPLYVGRARDLRARLRSYFAGGRQRPAVEAALGALERVDWTVSRLRARGGARGAPAAPRAAASCERPQHPRPTGMSISAAAAPLDVTLGADAARPAPGPAARAHAPRGRSTATSRTTSTLRCPVLRERLRRLGREQRFEDAARLRDRLHGAREAVTAFASSSACARSRRASSSPPASRGSSARTRSPVAVSPRCASCHVVPAPPTRPRRSSPRRHGAAPSMAPEDADELRLVASFLRRPPPELRVAAARRCCDLRSRARGYPWPRDERGRRRSHAVRRSSRRRRRAQALPARRRARPDRRPAPRRASRRGCRRTGGGRRGGRALLQGDRGRRRAVRRGGQAAGGVLRGAGQRRLARARGRVPLCA